MLVGCEGEVVARRSIILRLAGRARSGAMARICFWKNFAFSFVIGVGFVGAYFDYFKRERSPV